MKTMHKTNRFHLAVRMNSDSTQRTSKRCKNISHASRLRLVTYVFVLTTLVDLRLIYRVSLQMKSK